MTPFISKASDIITLRILMNLTQGEISARAGLSIDSYNEIEGERTRVSRRVALALRAVVEQHPNSEAVKSIYLSMNTERYERFLRSLSKAKRLPRIQHLKCPCGSTDITYDWQERDDYDFATGKCVLCGKQLSITSPSTLRHLAFQRDPEISLFQHELYDLDLWKQHGFKVNRYVD
ncbi:helix-turn-helix domain-containing protein [Vibrio mediterranei]|uniref:helix-turn-helix domain-containing protein n=1 Tax=Vibrio mediterranei TaxID=689 RepID=UPI004068DD84